MKKEICLSLAVTAAGMVSVANAATRPEKPNVLFILTDDLGWQDLKCYDVDTPSLYDTPNLDAFSKESIMFWQAYSPAPVSAPTRGSIISGKHPARLQRTSVSGGNPIVPGSVTNSAIMQPWWASTLDPDLVCIPDLLKQNGYVSGHTGKWHISAYTTYPTPMDYGFDHTTGERGATQSIKPHRLSAFATTDDNDPYKLDENGFPRDQNNLNALAFLEDNKDKPFFLYYCTWLVHAPIQTRAKHLLEKYAKRMNVPVPTTPDPLNNADGQTNPYYGAMVEMMDYYIGQVLSYMKNTDDPRWPGHKLIENTYIIFTSDNGGMEGNTTERFTDNYPLDRGKIWVQEGGIRVPLFITGPNLSKGVQSDVMINGLDFFPTIMSWTGTKVPEDLVLDGLDLSTLLKKDPKNANLVVNKKGEVRNSMMHHFPHARSHSSYRLDGYKLIHNFDPNHKTPLELYQLYDKNNKRVDIEEQKNLAAKMPDLAAKMDKMLMDELKGMSATYPYLNPDYKGYSSKKANFPEVTGNGSEGNKVWITYKENKNKVVEVFVIYQGRYDAKGKEWSKIQAKIVGKGKAEVTLPKGATKYIFGMVDNENFYHDYPKVAGAEKGNRASIKNPNSLSLK